MGEPVVLGISCPEVAHVVVATGLADFKISVPVQLRDLMDFDARSPVKAVDVLGDKMFHKTFLEHLLNCIMTICWLSSRSINPLILARPRCKLLHAHLLGFFLFPFARACF